VHLWGSTVNENQVYIKTVLGSQELQSRARRLPSRVRTLLILVDGVQTLGQLQAAAMQLSAPEASVQLLIEQGLIEAKPKSSARLAAPAGAPTDITPKTDGEAVCEPVSTLGSLDVDLSVEPVLTDAARYLAAQKLMNDSAVDALGFRAFFFTLKLERSFNCDDLRATLPDFSKALSKGKDPAAAALIEARVRVLLNAKMMG
jgi:hypothetical protein